MATIKVSGLVLREELVDESNKRLTILTKQLGKVQVFARGARNAKSKLAFTILSCCEFVLYDGGNFFSLTQVSPQRHFSNILQDYDAFVASCFILELADKTLLAGMDAKKALRLVVLSLARLDKTHNHKVILAVFIFKFLQIEGYMPMLKGESFGEDGLGENGRHVVTPTADAIRYIITSEIDKIFNFKVSQAVADELLECALFFLRANVDAQLKSMKFFSACN